MTAALLCILPASATAQLTNEYFNVLYYIIFNSDSGSDSEAAVVTSSLSVDSSKTTAIAVEDQRHEIFVTLEAAKDYYITVVPESPNNGQGYPYLDQICSSQGCTDTDTTSTGYTASVGGQHTLIVRGHGNYIGDFKIVLKPVPTASPDTPVGGTVTSSEDQDYVKATVEYSNYYDVKVTSTGGNTPQIVEACAPSGICESYSSDRLRHFYADEPGLYTFKLQGTGSGSYDFAYSSLPRADADEISMHLNFESGSDTLYIQSAMEYMAEFEKKYSFKVITEDMSTGTPRFMEICPHDAPMGVGSGQCVHNTQNTSDPNHMHMEGMTVQSTGNFLVRIDKYNYSVPNFTIDVLGTND